MAIHQYKRAAFEGYTAAAIFRDWQDIRACFRGVHGHFRQESVLRGQSKPSSGPCGQGQPGCPRVSLSSQQREILGLEMARLCEVNRHYLQPQVHRAFAELAAEAEKAGFGLAIASAHRSFERQLRIWNGKLCGERPVLDDRDRPIDLSCLDSQECLHRVLRFSALPGTSRHHWGSDLDVYDAAAVPADYRVQLSVAEVEGQGVFAPLHDWLDERISSGQSFGFYRPYDRDRGGVAPERWHLSYAPIASLCSPHLDARCLREAWAEVALTQEFLSLELVEAELESLLERYVERVAAPPPAALTYFPAG